MSAKQQMNDLAERRRLLAMEADLHRSLIGLECGNLRARLEGLREERKRITAGNALWIAGGAVAGLLAVRRWRNIARWLPAGVTALRWFRRWRQDGGSRS
jgi:hypothetical protein